MSHHIDASVLRKAAEHLLTIADAGYAEQFERELFETTEGDREFAVRCADNRFALSLAGNAVDTFAKRLAAALDAPLEQCRGVAMDLLGYAPRRQVAVELLARMAGDVQRLQRQAARTRFTRRSA